MDLPFTAAQFFQVIEDYNSSLFPAQIILLLSGAIAFMLLYSKSRLKSIWIGAVLAILWLWTGIAYHLLYFTSINPAAYIFGSLFIIQGIVFAREAFISRKLEFIFMPNLRGYMGLFFILFGLILYPIILFWMEKSWVSVISMGLPCPTTILSFGFMIQSTEKFPKYLLIVPSLWAIIGTSAAFHFGVYPDFMIIASALAAFIFLVGNKRRKVIETA